MRWLALLAILLVLPAHGLERRGKQRRHTPLLEILPGGPYESQLGQERLQGSRGETITTPRASTRGCDTGTGTTIVASGVECLQREGFSPSAQWTNLFVRSKEGNNWGRALAVTWSADADVAPDGTTTADRMQEDNTNSQHLSDAFGVTTTIGQTYIMSIYAKAGTRNWVYAVKSGGSQARAWYNLTTCALGTVESGVTAYITGPDSRGYCRLTAVIDGPLHIGGVSHNFGWALATGDNVATYVGGGATQYATFWNAQLVAGAVQYPICETAAVSATCNADYGTVPVPAEMSAAEGCAKYCITPTWTGNYPGSNTFVIDGDNISQVTRFAFINAGATPGNLDMRMVTLGVSQPVSWVAGQQVCFLAEWSQSGSFDRLTNLRTGTRSVNSTFNAVPTLTSPLGIGALNNGSLPASGLYLSDIQFGKLGTCR
jgi:hypothetical protein